MGCAMPPIRSIVVAISMSDILIEVKDLYVKFFLAEGTVHAVNGVNFNIERGKTLGIVGESGCGKSVTARAMLNMVRPRGRIISGEMKGDGLRRASGGEEVEP